MRVYLAGPILGCTGAQANDWRVSVASTLAAYKITGISPLRCEPLRGERYGMGYDDPRFGTARAIASKNLFDVETCEMTLAYLPKPPADRHQSYGTIVEIAWAKKAGRPAIVVTDDPEIKNHPCILACAAWVLDTLPEAIDVCIGILGGYVGGKNV